MKARFGQTIVGVAALALASIAPPASAAEVGLGVHAGTLGAGLDLGVGVNEKLVARVGFNKLTISEDFTEDDIDYSADLELESIHALADWHVLGGGFRITGGVVFNNNAFSGSASVDAGDDIGGQPAPSDGELNLDVTYDDVAPYIGIGWGNRVHGWSKLAFSVDAGLMLQGEASVDIDDNGTTGVSQDDLDAEAKEVEDELEDFDIYPVLSASIIYRF